MGYVQGAVTYGKVLAKNLFQCTEEQRFISFGLSNLHAKRQNWGLADTRSKFYRTQRNVWRQNDLEWLALLDKVEMGLTGWCRCHCHDETDLCT